MFHIFRNFRTGLAGSIKFDIPIDIRFRSHPLQLCIVPIYLSLCSAGIEEHSHKMGNAYSEERRGARSTKMGDPK